MAKKFLIVLADGFEEIEAITPIDVLRRAGLDVVIAGLNSRAVAGAHGIKFEADVTLENYTGLPDALILPGGLPGSENLRKSSLVAELVKQMNEAQKIIGAICAAPALVLAPTGVLDHKKATCYPGFEKNFPPSVQFSPERVVCDGNIITSRGPGSAMEFALALARQLASPEKAEELRSGMLAKA